MPPEEEVESRWADPTCKAGAGRSASKLRSRAPAPEAWAEDADTTEEKPRRGHARRPCCSCRNAVFGVHVEMAARGSVMALVLSLPFLVPGMHYTVPGTYYAIVLENYYDNSALVAFIFTYYKTVGETLCFAKATMLGTVLAALNIWILNGIFPSGCTGVVTRDEYNRIQHIEWTSELHIWWLGVLDLVVCTLLILGLKFDNSVRMFFLSWHVYFMMTFLNPESNRFNKAFHIEPDGPALNSVIQSSLGVVAAIIATLLPYPAWALVKSTETCDAAICDLAEAWDAAIESFTFEVRHRVREDRIIRKMRAIQTKVAALRGHLRFVWWECACCGRRKKARQALDRVIVQGLLDHSSDRLNTVLYCCRKDDYCLEHQKAMTLLKPFMKVLNREASNLLYLEAKIAGSGSFEESMHAQVSEQINKVRHAIGALSREFLGLPNVMEAEMVEERSFCLMLCIRGRLAIEAAEALSVLFSGGSWGELWDWMDPGMIIDVTKALVEEHHISFFVRNSVSVLTAFCIGYYGYSATVHSFNYDPAATVSLLLSGYVGSAVQKNLGRLQGVTLGTVLGTLSYAILAWCTWWGYLLVAFALGVITFYCLLVYFDSADFGYIGCIGAAFAVKNMMKGCSDEVFDPLPTYHAIINTIIGIVTMTLVDFLLSHRRTSAMAHRAFKTLWEHYRESVTESFSSNLQSVGFNRGFFENQLTAAQTLVHSAKFEPRWWRTKWKEHHWSHALEAARHLLAHHGVVSSVLQVRGSKAEAVSIPDAGAAWHDLLKHILEDMQVGISQISELLHILMHEEGDGFLQKLEDLERGGGLARLEWSSNLPCFNDVSDAMEGEDLIRHESNCISTLEKNTKCKLSVVFTAFEAQMQEMFKLKHKLLCD